MNREDIIKLARDCGINFHQAGWPELERFATLVAAAKETELMDSMTIAYMSGYQKGKDAGAAAEREACAKVCESMRGECWAYDHDKIAAAIRARGRA